MKYTPLNKQLYIENRKKFVRQMEAKSVAVFNSNDIMPTNADGTMSFQQNSDLLSLTGIDQENTILVLSPNFFDPNFREILFIKQTNEHIAIWEGNKLSKEQAINISGISTVVWLENFETLFKTLVFEADNIYLNTNEHIRSENKTETCDRRFIKWCKETYPIHQYRRSAPIMNDIRSTKSLHEIEALQTACNITEKGFRRILKFVKKDVAEYEIEAEYLHEFVRNKSRGFAYSPIIASGGSSCVLHYLENNNICKSGDILLMDVGAEYANYRSDMTRCIPVSGKFTERQKQVYNAVLNVKNEAAKMLSPGNRIPEYHKEIGKIMESELVGLGLITKKEIQQQNDNNPVYKKYFMHGTSHHIGLDTHDTANIYKEMKEGMVLTVEPGIYISEEKLGIRLEDNYVITNEMPLNLMKNIPIEIEEIEYLMNDKK